MLGAAEFATYSPTSSQATKEAQAEWDAHVDAVAAALVFEFMVDELTSQWCELAIAARVMRPGPVPRLCRVRPLREAA